MRLWSLHPRLLDRQGLLALWREGLLARKVLAGGARGYRNHPQLQRFREHPRPPDAIAAYLHAVADEAERRGYRFDRARIGGSARVAAPLPVTQGQLEYEAGHLRRKLETRRAPASASPAPPSGDRTRAVACEPHPLFRAVPGGIAAWERPRDSATPGETPSGPPASEPPRAAGEPAAAVQSEAGRPQAGRSRRPSRTQNQGTRRTERSSR